MQPHLLSTIYRSPEGQEKVLRWYDEQLSKNPIPCETRMLDTKAGATHVLVMGPEDAPPLVLFHGLSINALAVRRFWLHLAKHFRVYAPDIIGQPGKSAPTRPERNGKGYPEWACEVMDALSLPKANVMGISFGGWLTLKLAEHAPERIEKAVLCVPAGLAPMRWRAKLHFARRAVPYMLAPTDKRLMKLITPLFSSGIVPESDLVDLMRIVFHQVKNKPEPFKVFKKEQFFGLRAPVLMLGGENDIFYRIDLLLEGAKRILPPHAICEMLPGQGHIFFDSVLEQSCERIRLFLDEK